MENCNLVIVENSGYYSTFLQGSFNPVYHVSPLAFSNDFTLPGNTPRVLIVVLDDNVPANLISRLDAYTDTPVIMIVNADNIPTLQTLAAHSGIDLIIKTKGIELVLEKTVQKTIAYRKLANEVENLKTGTGNNYSITNTIKGNSAAIRKVHAQIDKAIASDICVTITGESGTGKELTARIIHYNSSRRTERFIAIDALTVTAAMLQDIMNVNTTTGRGTICISNISCLNPEAQQVLLDNLKHDKVTGAEDKQVQKQGARIISINKSNLYDEVEKGNFLEDLYFSVIGLPIELPALRDREQDVLILSKYFLENFCLQHQSAPVKMEPQAMTKLLNYGYPGNINELKSVIELAASICTNHTIESNDIIFHKINRPGSIFNEEKSLRQYNIEIINYYMKKYNNNIQEVAERLDIGRSTIYKMMQNKEIIR